MKYQVIARRYRPKSFDEVVGQEAAASTLRNAILQDRLAHAYLFCGPRGIGKTSMARIFARALNCPRSADRSLPPESWGLPCGECEICRAVHDGTDSDVIEMDGASNRGIEDVREIIDGVKFSPINSPYKIYIVDEVHMLTREAFNAFLKVLEEPPAHVKFVFATTEPHKIPDTVLSRCQRFDFHPIGETAIVRRLRQICDAEGARPESGLLERIARYSQGGLRDSQTVLDQLISFSQGDLLNADLDRITGRVTDERLEALATASLGGDSPRTLELLGAFFREGTDPAVLVDQLVESLRSRLGEAVRSAEGGGKADREGGSSRLDRLLGCLQILHETALRLKGSPYPQLAVELALVRVARLEDVKGLEETVDWLRRFEGALRAGGGATPRESGDPVAQATPPAALRQSRRSPSRTLRAAPPPEDPAGGPPGGVESCLPGGADPPVRPAPDAQAAPVREGSAAGALPVGSPVDPDFGRLREVWDQIMIEHRQREPQVHAFLRECRLSEGGPGTLVLELPSDFHCKQMSDPRRAGSLEAVIREVSGAAWKVQTRLDEERRSTAATPREPAGPSLREDPLVVKTMKLFRGRQV